MSHLACLADNINLQMFTVIPSRPSLYSSSGNSIYGASSDFLVNSEESLGSIPRLLIPVAARLTGTCPFALMLICGAERDLLGFVCLLGFDPILSISFQLSFEFGIV